MAILIGPLKVLLVIVCLALIGLILIQRGKGGGLAGMFGGGGIEQAFGTRAATLAQKATALLAVLFLVLSIFLGRLMMSHQGVGPAAPAETVPAAADTTPAESDPADSSTP